MMHKTDALAMARHLACAAVVLVATAGQATSAPAPQRSGTSDGPAPKMKIDRMLLKRLTRDIVDEIPTGKDAVDGGAQPETGEANDDLQPGEEMHRSQVANPAETLDRVAGAMREASDLISAAKDRERARTLQDKAVEELDALIDAARSSQPPSGGSKGKPKPDDSQPPPGEPKPGQPQQPAQSGAQAGTASAIRTDAESEAEARRSAERAQQWIERVWGHLPEREREQLRQFGTDVFLPGYESLIEEYFKRLAEEADK